MQHTSVKGIAAFSAITDIWPVALSPDRAARSMPWLSAEDAARAAAKPATAAEAQARQVLRTNGYDSQARFLLAQALIRQAKWKEAGTLLEALSQTQPQMEFVWRGLGQVLARSGAARQAVEAYERALDLEIRGKEAWFALGSLRSFFSNDAYRISARSAVFAEIEHALANDRLDAADSLSVALLESRPEDPVARKLRADVLIGKSRWPEAKRLLARAVETAPDYVAARFRLATMLFAHGEFGECVAQIERLLETGCDTPLLRGAMAVALAHEGDYSRAIESFDAFLAQNHRHPGLWLEYARVLRSAGDRRMAMAFRQATETLPSFFTAWYALATVKSFRWDETLVAQIRAQLARPDLAIDDRAIMQFVLGRALDDLQRYAEAFESFRASKTTLREISPYMPKASQTAWRRTRLLFTPAFLRKHAGTGSPATAPIFIVGMPRVGSTLVEQIISAHSQVEALGELSALPTLVERLYTRAGGPRHWPLLLGRLRPGDFRTLGEEYLRAVKAFRKTDAPFFTDKQLGNFQQTGLIHLMLPNARIVDVRRHPLDCGLSCFKHHFPGGRHFARDLGDIGHRYVEYVRLMAHFDEVLPGKVHRIIYERLVHDFETEVRRLLDYLGLPFEPACLRFFENRRTVETLSYEQVLMPLYQSGMGQWRHYEPWLGPLKDALGCVLDAWPAVPKFFPEVHATSRAPRTLGGGGGRFGSMKGVRQRPFMTASAPAPPHLRQAQDEATK